MTLRPDSVRDGEEPLDGLHHHLMTCIIERVARSGEPFVLRGGMLTRAWVAPLPRATRDLDFVGDFAFDIADTARRLRGALALPLDDGACLDLDRFAARGIWEDTAFPGVHVDVAIGIAVADATIGIDVGFRDPLVPPPTTGLFGARVVRAETQLAWKLHALAESGDAWRPKDLADLWLYATRVPLDDALLAPAIDAAFASRGYPPAGARAVLDDARWTTKAARVRWNGARGIAVGDALAAVRERLAAPLAALDGRS
jgi:hypothetical protein